MRRKNEVVDMQVPKCMEEMKSLTWLVVRGYNLDCVCEGMGRLEKLPHLDLSNNKRSVKLRECIKEMKSLTWLVVHACDLDCLLQ